MKKLLISILCMGMMFLGTGCSKSDDSTRKNSYDAIISTDNTFDSSFELVSHDKLDNVTSIYVVKDKTTNKEYIIIKCRYAVSITERIE